MTKVAILLGGGEGRRMKGFVEDKILASLGGKPVFAYSIETFIKSKVVDTLVIIYRNEEQKAIIDNWIQCNIFTSIRIIWSLGGNRRQDSVLNGLKSLEKETEHVYIHDMARPFIQEKALKEVEQSLKVEDAVVMAHPVIDTIKQVLPETPTSLNYLDRNTLWAMETPQAFKYSVILRAYLEVEKHNLEITDEASAVSLLSHPIIIVENCLPNPKITTQSDLEFLEYLLMQKNHASF